MAIIAYGISINCLLTNGSNTTTNLDKLPALGINISIGTSISIISIDFKRIPQIGTSISKISIAFKRIHLIATGISIIRVAFRRTRLTGEGILIGSITFLPSH